MVLCPITSTLMMSEATSWPDDALPLFLREVFADAVGAECVVAELFDAVRCFAEDDVYDVA